MEYMYIGRVANTHGVKGVIKVLPTTDDPKRFELLKKITIEDARGKEADYTVIKVKYLHQFVLLELKEVMDMNMAESLKLGIIKIPKEDALPLETDEYYVQDLIGLKVYDHVDIYLGIIKDVLFTGSNEVYVVTLESGKELLLPAIKDCILNVDMAGNKMKVYVMEGLM
ncbi:MAG: 16S rRNA processing protein RimM [Firmicutes bacterium HGW-Firmicutes-3]|jgi:16S rRNA processing protein RimM|nr:MAG: 16S rRNA processing protein RimM [Firmicutes bacterium HGW-Firmicutes-3]